MLRAAIYDEFEMMAPGLTSLLAALSFEGLCLMGTIAKDPAMYVQEKRIEILFYALYDGELRKLAQFAELIKKCPDTYFIAVSAHDEFGVVREVFRAGVFDYLLQPVASAEMENSLKILESVYSRRYLTSAVIHKFDALISHIFQGGGLESGICAAIISEIHAGAHMDDVARQLAVQNAKEKIYLDMIYKKPWLEKFTRSELFSAPASFRLMDKAEILTEWIRDFSEVGRVVKKYQMIDDPLIYHIGKYIVVHVDERLSLDELSARLYLNKTYISHIFKKVSGVSLVNFQLDTKIDRAKILLRNESLKISDIAEQIGYGNVDYFRRIFRDITGMSPTEYRACTGIKG
jgi:two-component system response regulator YesN